MSFIKCGKHLNQDHAVCSVISSLGNGLWQSLVSGLPQLQSNLRRTSARRNESASVPALVFFFIILNVAQNVIRIHIVRGCRILWNLDITGRIPAHHQGLIWLSALAAIDTRKIFWLCICSEMTSLKSYFWESLFCCTSYTYMYSTAVRSSSAWAIVR